MKRITEKMLMDWAGPRRYAEGLDLFERGNVRHLEVRPPLVRGEILAGVRTLRTALQLQADGSVVSLCPCYDNRERGVVCAHVIALGLALRRYGNDPDRLQKIEAERRRAERLARADGGQLLRRVPKGRAGAVPAALDLALGPDWLEGWRRESVPVHVQVRVGGRLHPVDALPPGAEPLGLDAADESLLFVLEDIAAGALSPAMRLRPADFLNVLGLLSGRTIRTADPDGGLSVETFRLDPRLTVRLDAQTGALRLDLETAGPDGRLLDRPAYLAHRREGWAVASGRAWPLQRLLPEPFHAVYRHPVNIERMSVPRFLQSELPALTRLLEVDCDAPPDLFTIEPARPAFRLLVRGSPASLAATLYAEYDGTALIAAKADPAGGFAIPDPDDPLRYTVRNPAAESDGLERIGRAGFSGPRGDELKPVVGETRVLNFLGRDLPALRRRGWKVELAGRVRAFADGVAYATPVVAVEDRAGGWFDVRFDFEATRGPAIAPAAIQRALLMGDSFVRAGGRPVLFDAGAVEAMTEVFRDCEASEGAQPGSFRLGAIHAGYVKASLDALDGVELDAAPDWREAASGMAAGRPDEPDEPSLNGRGELRPYQKDGVRWLRFLERGAFGGILADEMGLGKTVQALVWLQFARLHPGARGKPALVVCPTSLVENWAEEAARFTPDLRVRILSGAGRHEHWAEAADSHLLITSYALLRRDIDRYAALPLSAAILDEAQHIKNRTTQNALAAKSLRATHRLVLTGTPVENSVADLWSIMDFLMKGYLGGYRAFRQRYELPIAQGGEEGEAAQARLRRKLGPFLLRRLKRDVARELPPKILRTAHCALSPEQQAVYARILDAARNRLARGVAERGFEAMRMEALKALLRLRQVCCHLGLLRLPEAERPSAKMELFFELLDEAFDANHRVLVFSQFVSMLHILRREIDRRGLRACYLDGATKDRLAVVREFNTRREIPLFLISLKAGGTGLNLTGADMVIHYDPWWNPAVEDQATDRAYRIGQRRTVYAVKLIARGTVEEKVLAMQRRKQAVIDATVRADETGGAGRLEWEDVRELLDL